MIYTAHIGLSYKCNLRCQHCFVHREIDNNFIIDNYKHIIDTLYDNGLFMLFYTYGEPLANKEFFEIAEYVKQKNISQTLMTNGWFIRSQEDVYSLQRCGITRVFVSVDSINSNDHDINRGKKGAWKSAIDAINILVSCGIKTGIACTITDKNYSEIKSIYNLGNDLGVDYISFLRCRVNGYLLKIPNFEVYANSIEEILIDSENKLMKINIHDTDLIPTLQKMQVGKMISEKNCEYYKNMCKCHLDTNINITPNGLVYGCDFSQKILGDLTKDNLSDILKINKKACGCLGGIYEYSIY